MNLAVEHAGNRVQFGSPIGRFQAVQHLLAEAELQRQVLQTACAVAVRTPWYDEALAGLDPIYLKALAGRCGRIVMQNSLQVLGAIGFTEEHEHHRFARRMLALDGLYGSSARLTEQIGADVRCSGRAWQSKVLR
jgi:alkylation response protein AidB-like acyl-CoA dehydrogenase